MRFWTFITISALLSSAAAAQSGTERRRLRQVPVPPELADDFYPGDRWVRVELDLDATGAVSNCRVLESNEANRQQLWFMCRAFSMNYRGAPLPDGAAPETRRVRQVSLLPGNLHRRRHPHEPRRD